ncbi:Anaerobic selenocysteine-containing dehydrogenase [Spirosomataceae bacterium TFI 002]|nr:Anaerobic selenocysteine-containing dehydrogenase [Spirosomataceae bacterium TFI 002]
MPEEHFRTCNLCEAMCGLKITYEGKNIHKIEGDQDDPLSRGHICPKAFGLKDIYEDPDRLKKPLKRTGETWEEVSWETAYEDIANKIVASITKHGLDSIGIYQGNPSIHNLGTMLFGPSFFKAIKTKNNYTATSTDQLPHHFASWLMYGHPLLVPIPDIDRTNYWLILGGNPLVSNGSMMTVPDVGNRIKELQNRGGKVVVIDPRLTETANKADRHHFIKPGSDAWLLGAIANYILSNNLQKLGKLENLVEDLEKLKAALEAFDIEKASQKTGISAQEIKKIAMELVESDRSAVYGRVGVSTQSYGGLCHWLINVLNIITGNLDKEGGAMFPLPAIDFIGKSKEKNRFNRWQSRVRKFPEFLGELPTACLSEEIETEGEGQIKVMLTSCGNPVISTTNGARLDKALEKLDFMVSFDIYLNETTRHADYILPPATGLETSHYDLTFHNLAVRNTTKYSPPLFAKSDGAKYDWEIFQELGQVLYRKAFDTDLNGNVIYTPEQILAQKLKEGPYKIDFKQLVSEKHGIDLGELKPQLPERLVNTNKKINIAPDLLIADIERLLNHRDQEGYLLIGKRHLRDNNSWMHNSTLLQKGKDRCVLHINPKDAEKEGFADKEIVTITSRVGSLDIKLSYSPEMMEGVLAMPHGYGHNKKGIKLGVAQQKPGESVNDLTDENLIDELTGNAAFSNVYVTLSKAN